MMLKQVSWRRSNRALFLFSLLLVPMYLFSADPGGAAAGGGAGGTGGGHHSAGKDDDPSYGADSSDSRMFFNYTYDHLERAYERAPREVKHLITMLQHDGFRKTPQVRARLFQGVPGTEKTTSAYMVCYMLRTLFKCHPIDCGKLSAKGRGAVPELFRKEIEDALTSKPVSAVAREDSRGTMFVLDECQEVLDHADDPHFDTATNARFLAGFIDSQRNNENVFVLATCNSDENFSDQIKSRFTGHTVFFKTIEGPEGRLAALREHISQRGIALDESCDDSFLLEQMQALNGWIGRDFELLATPLIEAYLDDDGDLSRIVINKDQIIRAIASMQKAVTHAKKEKSETAQEQAERLHKQAIAVQLKMASRQKAQYTGGVSITGSKNTSIGTGGCQVSYGGSVTGSVSRTTAPGMGKSDAENVYRETFGEELDDAGAGAGAEEVKPSAQGPINGELIYWELVGGMNSGHSFMADSTGALQFKKDTESDFPSKGHFAWIVDGKKLMYDSDQKAWVPFQQKNNDCVII